MAKPEPVDANEIPEIRTQSNYSYFEDITLVKYNSLLRKSRQLPSLIYTSKPMEKAVYRGGYLVILTAQ